jgi:hypothetical protein
MNPINEIVCNLLETPFNRWTDEDKRDVLLHGRPTGILNIDFKKELKKVADPIRLILSVPGFQNIIGYVVVPPYKNCFVGRVYSFRINIAFGIGTDLQIF